MMKRLTMALVLALSGMGGLAFAQAVDGKIGLVDVNGVIAGSADGKKLIEKLNGFHDTKQGELQAKQKEIDDMQARLQTQQLTLSDDARAKIETDIRSKTTTLQRLREDAEAELNEMKESGARPIYAKLLPIIQQFAKSNAYSLILDKNQAGIIVSDAALDVSEPIRKLLDESVAKPAEAPKPGEKKQQ